MDDFTVEFNKRLPRVLAASRRLQDALGIEPDSRLFGKSVVRVWQMPVPPGLSFANAAAVEKQRTKPADDSGGDESETESSDDDSDEPRAKPTADSPSPTHDSPRDAHVSTDAPQSHSMQQQDEASPPVELPQPLKRHASAELTPRVPKIPKITVEDLTLATNPLSAPPHPSLAPPLALLPGTPPLDPPNPPATPIYWSPTLSLILHAWLAHPGTMHASTELLHLRLLSTSNSGTSTTSTSTTTVEHLSLASADCARLSLLALKLPSPIPPPSGPHHEKQWLVLHVCKTRPARAPCSSTSPTSPSSPPSNPGDPSPPIPIPPPHGSYSLLAFPLSALTTTHSTPTPATPPTPKPQLRAKHPPPPAPHQPELVTRFTCGGDGCLPALHGRGVRAGMLDGFVAAWGRGEAALELRTRGALCTRL